MDNKSEPSLVPQWLKNTGSGNLTAGGITSLSLSDDQGVLKSARNKSDFDRTTSSYLRRNTCSNNGSAHARSYSSFGRNQRDRDLDFNKEIYKEKSGFNDYSRANRDTLPTMFEKDRLRRTQSYRGDTWQKTNININPNGNSVLRSAHKGSFERDFPSLDNNNEIKRVPSPIQKLLISSSAMIGGDGWTSALAEVPAIVSGSASSASAGSSHSSALSMAETVAQLPSRTQSTPQLSFGTHRLEEIALKQSRQLIPVITSAPKPLMLSTIDKSKPKHQISSPRGVVGPTIGKLQVLKLKRDKNEISQIPKDTNNNSNNNINSNINNKNYNTTKLPNSPQKSPTDRKPAAPDKRLASNAQSRHEFFNNVRKKSMTNNMSPSVPVVPEASINKDNNILVTDSDDVDNGGSDGSDKILIPYTEEEEVSLLRSMGWDENCGEEGLTEEEINAFCTKYASAKLSAKVYPGMVSVKSDQGR